MRAAFAIALAWVSGPLRASADDAAKITPSGYLEVYDSLNLGWPSHHDTNLRGFDDRERTLTLSNVALGGKAEKGPLTAIAIFQVGSTPTTYYQSEPGDPSTWKYIQQATLAYATPEVTIQAGLFPSPIGPEVIPIKDDWNWSRSDLFFALPFYHTGIIASHPLGDGWTAAAHVYNGWNSVVDNNDEPSIGASLAYASKRVPAAQVMYFGGVERAIGAPEGSPWRHLLDAYAQVAVTDTVSVMVHGDGGFERNRFGTSGWLAGAAYGKIAICDRLYAAPRADLFREWVADGAAPVFWPTRWIGSLTATLAWQPTDGLSVRLEARHDQARGAVFHAHDTGLRTSRDTITLGAVAWF